MPVYKILDKPTGKILKFESEEEYSDGLVDDLYSQPETQAYLSEDRKLTRVEYEQFDKYKTGRDWFGDKGKIDAAMDAGGDALSSIGDTFMGAMSETFSGDITDVKKGTKSLIEAGARGTADVWQLASNIVGSIGDEAGGYSSEEEYDREYERYTSDYESAKTRPEGVFWGDDEVHTNLTELGSFFLDPTIVVGGTLWASPLKAGARAIVKKGAAKAGKVSHKLSSGFNVLGKVAEKPRKWTEKVIEKVSGGDPDLISKGTTSGVVGGAVIGIPGVREVAALEGATKTAGAVSEFVGDALDILSAPSGQKRFLQRLSMDHGVFKKAPWLRTAAGLADEFGGTGLGDFAFDYLTDTMSIGTLQVGLAYAAGGGAEEIGAGIATAGGLAPLSATFARSHGGATTDLYKKTGQGDSLKYEPTQRSREEVDIFTKQLHGKVQKEAFEQMPDYAQALVATMNSAGFSPEVRFADSKFIESYFKLEEERMERLGIKKPAPENFSPKGFFDPDTNVLLVNKDKINGSNPKEVVELMLHEYGHSVFKKMISRDASIGLALVDKYKSDETKGTKYNYNGEEVYLDKNVDNFVKEYNAKAGKDILSSDDAGAILDEIGAEQFAMMLSKDENIFNHMKKPGRVSGVLNKATSKVLESIGLTNDAGKLLSNPIANSLKKSPEIMNMYRNQAKLEKKIIQNREAQVASSEKIVSIKGNADKVWEDRFGGTVYKKTKAPKKIGKMVQEAHKQEPSHSDYANVGAENGGTRILPSMHEYLQGTSWGKELSSKLMDVERAIANNRALNFMYSPRVKGKGNNVVDNYRVTPFSMFWSKAGNPLVVAWKNEVLENNLYKLAKAGFGESAKQLQDQLTALMDEISNRPDGQEAIEKNKIGNDVLAAAFGAKRDVIRDPKLNKWLLENDLANPIKRFRIADAMGIADGGVGKNLHYPNVKIGYRGSASYKASPENAVRYSPNDFNAEYDTIAQKYNQEPGVSIVKLRAVIGNVINSTNNPDVIKDFDRVNKIAQLRSFEPNKKPVKKERFKAKKGEYIPLESKDLYSDDISTIEGKARALAKQEVYETLWNETALTQDLIHYLQRNQDPSKLEIDPPMENIGNKEYFSEIYERYLEELADDPDGYKSELEDLFIPDGDLFEWAKQNHGVTEDIYLSGYILPDGTMLDFSEGSGSRGVDHRAVNWPKAPQAENWETMEAFIDEGAVRMDANGEFMNIKKFPNNRQQRKIEGIVDEVGSMRIEVEEGGRSDSVVVDADNIDKAMGQVRRFYNGGEVSKSYRFSPDGTVRASERTALPKDVKLDKVSDGVEVTNKPTNIRFLPSWHSSPHDIKKFSTDFMGTGEGNQAYGWGLYFGNEDVSGRGGYYDKMFSNTIRYKGKVLPDDGTPQSVAIETLWGYDGDKANALEDASPWLKKHIEKIDYGDVEIGSKVYEVNILPDVDKLLLWDKPMSEQSAFILQSLSDLTLSADFKPAGISAMRVRNMMNGDLSQATPRDLLNGLAEGNYESKKASMALLDAGIKGIQYADGASRTGKPEDFNFNYVLFDGNDVEIVKQSVSHGRK